MTRNPLRAPTKNVSEPSFNSAMSGVGPTLRKSLPVVNASAILLLFSLQKAANVPSLNFSNVGGSSSTTPHSGPSSGSASFSKSSAQTLGNAASSSFENRSFEDEAHSADRSTLVRK